MKRLLTILTLITALSAFSENPPALKLSLYPNPATTYVDISLNESITEDVVVTISDILGNKIATYTFKPGQTMRIEFNELDLKTGMYLIKAETNGESSLKRLVIKQ